MLAIGSGGLVINLVAAWVLRRSAEHSVNVEGAFRHVMADLMGSVGVVISGILIWAFGWRLADPILSVVIAILILLGTWRLFGKVIHVLLEGAPAHIDVRRLCSKMEGMEGVTLVHATSTSGASPPTLSAHVLIAPDWRDFPLLQRRLREVITHDFGIRHTTIQLEYSPDGCENENHHLGYDREGALRWLEELEGAEQGRPAAGRRL